MDPQHCSPPPGRERVPSVLILALPVNKPPAPAASVNRSTTRCRGSGPDPPRCPAAPLGCGEDVAFGPLSSRWTWHWRSSPHIASRAVSRGAAPCFSCLQAGRRECKTASEQHRSPLYPGAPIRRQCNI